MAKGFELPEYYLCRGRKVNLTLGMQVVREERASSHSLPSAVDHDLGPRPSSIAEETFESLEEIEAQTIPNLLPDDDDLFSGVTDGLDSIARPNNRDDMEDLDLCSSVGGLEDWS
ncbi:MEI2-like 4 [Olea europaea subsp. europaea]|uniref:MEI2-like 4 n=1 Tax=Olea europaea subsp. europaea TaxID=158383 RepID=A0A8S0RFQ0_OLEEU|nr:MEI2-like 4 [Olea europaea subsp. europaea]